MRGVPGRPSLDETNTLLEMDPMRRSLFMPLIAPAATDRSRIAAGTAYEAAR
jgi:hypothetical protein